MNSVLKLEKKTTKSGFYSDMLVMSWEGFETLTKRIADDIISYKERADASFKETPPIMFSGVFGFPRGGLILAVRLSHLLKLPLLMAPSKSCIVCDDISDTGLTLEKYTGNSSYYTATLLMRDTTRAVPAFIGERITTNHWVEFPWEANEY